MLPLFRNRNFFQAVLPSSYIGMFSVRPLRSTVVTRFFATMGLSDSRPVPPVRLCIPAERRSRCRFRTAGSPSFLNESFPARCPQPPRKARRCDAPVVFNAGGRLHHLRQAGRLSLSVTRPNRVYLHYGSQVRLTRLRQTDCSAPRSFGYMLNGQFTRWTPFIPQDSPVYWRSQGAETQRGNPGRWAAGAPVFRHDAFSAGETAGAAFGLPK